MRLTLRLIFLLGAMFLSPALLSMHTAPFEYLSKASFVEYGGRDLANRLFLQRGAATPFDPSNQPSVQADSEEIRVAVLGNEPCAECPSGRRLYIEFVAKISKETKRFALRSEIAQIDEIHILDRDKSALIGRVLPNTSMVTMVNHRNGKILDSFYCFNPNVSPDKRLVAYVKVYPAHFVQGESAQYLVYDFSRSPQENRPSYPSVSLENKTDVGIPIFPPSSGNLPGDNIGLAEEARHTLASEGLFWSVDSTRIAFADRHDEEIAVVLVDLSLGLERPLVSKSTLRTEEIVDTRACTQYRDRLQYAYHVTEINLPTNGNPIFMIHLGTHEPACLRRRVIALPLESFR